MRTWVLKYNYACRDNETGIMRPSPRRQYCRGCEYTFRGPGCIVSPSREEEVEYITSDAVRDYEYSHGKVCEICGKPITNKSTRCTKHAVRVGHRPGVERKTKRRIVVYTKSCEWPDCPEKIEYRATYCKSHAAIVREGRKRK